jgi:DNA-directed RNA polymerase specialized sigma subunit
VDSQPVIAGDAEAWELVARALRLLRMREKTVVYQMYFLNSTVKEVGRNLGLKRHAAWRIHRTALHKLRRCVGCSNRL